MRIRLARPRGERGSILVLSSVGMVLAMIAAGLAVDLGTLASEARRNQKVADLAALDASRESVANFQSAAQTSAARNQFPTGAGYSVTAVEGVKVDGGCEPQPGSGTVCVTATSPHENNFPFVSGPSSVSRSAMAGAGNVIGTVRVGSSVASASGTIPPTRIMLLNKIVSSLIGGSFSTNAIGWQGLANGTVTYGALTNSLAAVTGNGVFATGTPDQVLQSTFTASQLFAATANALNNSGNAGDVSIANNVQTIGAKVDGTYLNLPIKLYDLFDFGSVVVGNKQDVANATLNVWNLIRSGAIIANGTNFAAFDLLATDIVGTAIPGGFNRARVSMGLIEAPQQSFPGPAGMDALGNYYTSAHTSQVRVKVDVTIKVPLVSALTQTIGLVTVNLVPAGTLVEATFSYYLDAGEAHAYLEAIQCGTSAEPLGVQIKGVTDVGTSKLGLVSDTDMAQAATVTVQPVQTVLNLLGIVRVKTTGTVTTNIPGNSGEIKTFLPPYTTDGASQQVAGAMISLPSIAATNLTVEPLLVGLNTGTLVSDLVQGINATGLTFNSSSVGVTTTLLKPLYDAIGLSFGTADLWAPPVQTCAGLSPVPGQPGNPPVLRG